MQKTTATKTVASVTFQRLLYTLQSIILYLLSVGPHNLYRAYFLSPFNRCKVSLSLSLVLPDSLFMKTFLEGSPQNSINLSTKGLLKVLFERDCFCQPWGGEGAYTLSTEHYPGYQQFYPST